MLRTIFIAFAIAAILYRPTEAAAPDTFSFAAVRNVEAMQTFIRQSFPLGTSRDEVREVFVHQGKGTLKTHPNRPGVEKYIYDINLCSYYVWRWNISADYDPAGKLRQMYINGETVLPDGPPLTFSKPANPQTPAAIIKGYRERPLASKGESRMYFILMDPNVKSPNKDDEQIMGGGPTQADPIDLGRLHVYHVEPWRSIFDEDDADFIAPYGGDCKIADATLGGSRPNGSLAVMNTLIGAMNRAGSSLSPTDPGRP